MTSPETHSTTGGGARRSRGRLLVVGDGATLDHLAGGGRTVEVTTIFDALGEVTTATSRNPVDLVLIQRDAVQGPPGRAAEAIRRVDPAVRVALVLSPNGDVAADAEAFDAVVRLPEESDRLLELIEGHLVTRPRARASDADGDDDPIPEAPTATPAREAAPLNAEPWPHRPRRDPEIEESEAAELPDESATSALPAGLDTDLHREIAGDRPERRDEELGDVDLVQAVLEAPTGVLDTALQLIVQQTGWSDVRLLPGDQEPPEPSAEVRLGPQRFGSLTSQEAPSAELSPWADWLGRWLELDRSYRDYRLMAYQDDLTGAWNRRFFHAFLRDTLARARQLRRQITVMVFDIDDFKQYNDQFGHEAGDVVLTETVRLLNSVIRKGDRVCRIGGDEFAVIFADLEGPREVGSTHPSAPEQIAVRFQDQICSMQFPKLGREAPGNLSISAGLATFPWDGTTPEQLLREADRRALQSKHKGKNAITLGPGLRR